MMKHGRTQTALYRFSVWVDKGNESCVHYKVAARNNPWDTTDSN